MQIDVYFDTSCPWCYIGKRRLEAALRQRSQVQRIVTWRPFLLNPDLPVRGMSRSSYLRQKFGSAHRVNRIFETIVHAGKEEGIDFRFDDIARTPNTVLSHRLVQFAARRGRQADAVEAVFHAYFAECRDIGDVDALLEIGERMGLNRMELGDYLQAASDTNTIFAQNTRAHRLGITGVPCFIFNSHSAIAGAQEVEVFLRLIDLATEEDLVAASVS